MHIGITYHAAVVAAAYYRMHLGAFANRSGDIAGNRSVKTSAGDRAAVPVINLADFHIRVVTAGINAAVDGNNDIAFNITVIRAAVNIFHIAVHGNVNITLDIPTNSAAYTEALYAFVSSRRPSPLNTT